MKNKFMKYLLIGFTALSLISTSFMVTQDEQSAFSKEVQKLIDSGISKDDIKEISDFVNPLEKDTLYATSVVVDDTKNIEFVKNEIKKLEIVSDAYTIETVAGFDTGLISLIRVSCLVLLNVILVVTFFLAISYMKKRVIDENKNIDVM